LLARTLLVVSALGAAPLPGSALGAPGEAALLDIKVAGYQTPRTIRPGDALVPVYLLAVANTSLLGNSIQEITFENRTSGSGGNAQRDAEWQPLTLSASTNPGSVLDPATRVTLATASFSNGTLRFAGLDIGVPGFDSVYIVIAGGASLIARDGDALDLCIPGASSIRVANSSVDATGTLDPAGSFPVDGMVAAQLPIDTVKTAIFPIGATGQLALSVRIPPNGYADDRLEMFQIVNRGSASGVTDLARMDAWIDDGDGVYVPGQEAWLGRPVFTGSNWTLGGLSEDLPTSKGARLFLTVDVSEDAAEDRTVRLAIPVNGVTVESGNDGPLDREVANPVAHVISLIDRVVVAPIALPSGFANPGQARVPLFAMRATNAYTDTRTLTAITLTNTTAGPGTTAERDAELERLELRLDADRDGSLDDAAIDPVVGTAVFSNGRARFTGLSVAIPPGADRSLFVTGDVSLLHAADDDVLSAALGAREDLEFSPASAITGDFPVGSDNGWTVDGMVAAQVGNAGAPPRTLAPGDGPIEALDLLVRRNGYQDDVLQGITVQNLGTATAGDIAELRVWRDGGDGVFDGGGGDDLDLGALTAGAGPWTSAPLAVMLGAPGARLFVSVTASAAPTDSVTVQLAVPVNGFDVASGNDGPLDAALVNPDALLIANRGLLASLAFDVPAVTVGQNVTLRMTVRSTAPESLIAVTPSAPALAGGAALGPLTGPTPPSRDLAPGASGDFTWTYSADGAGTTRATARATGTGSPSGQPFVSLDALSNELRVFARADSLALTLSQAMPQSVTRGQTGVLPLYLTFVHPDSEGSAVRVNGLRVRLEREDGADVVPAALLARAAVLAASETLLVRTSLEGSGATLDLTLATPAIVGGTSPATLALALDISSSTVVPDFRIVITGAADVSAEDAATGAPVEVRLQSATWPFATGLARVLAGATELDVAADPLPPARAGQGQLDVTLATFTLQNPGVTGVTTDVRVGALDVKLADTLGVRNAKPGRIVKRLKVRSGTQTLADRSVAPGVDSVVALTLSPLLAVPVNTPIEMRLVADLSDTASLGPFRLELGDSARFDARDPNTGARVPIVYADAPPRGPAVTVEARADSVFALGVPHLPSELGIGARGVPALSIVLRHPGGHGTGPLRLDTLIVRCIDESGAPLVPAPYLDRMQVLWKGALVAAVPDPPTSGSTMTAALPALALEPGDTARVTLVLDFEATAPPTSFALAVGASGLDVVDANLGTAALAVVEGNGEFPLLSGITRLVAPSRLLTVDLEDAMPAVLAPDGLEVVAGTVRLANGAAAGSGPVRVAWLAVQARGASGVVPIGGATGQLAVWHAGAPFATGAALTPDSLTATIPFPAELLVHPGTPLELELRFSTRANPSVPTVALALEAGDIGVVQPGNPLLDVSVLPAPGRTFPLVTASATYGAAGLAESWSSYPNPFAPARGGATFTYYLPAPGRVTLEIWTARGERVVTLLDAEPRAAGLHQSDVWDGRNGAGALVQHGVYVADLTVRLDDGRDEHLRRKVAVVR
jgi:hypothetical protein